MKGLRIGGHPLHPALVHFPIAAWTAVPLLDVLYLTLRNPFWWQCAFWLLVVGTGMALLTMGAGLFDLLALPATSPAQGTAQRHLLLMGSAWCVFIGDLLLHAPGVAPSVPRIASGLTLSLAGLALMLAGAYAGGKLVYDFGVGQRDTHAGR